MVLDVKVDTSADMVLGGQPKEGQAMQGNGDGNGKGSVNHGQGHAVSPVNHGNVASHVNHGHGHAASPVNHSHGDGHVASPTASTALSTAALEAPNKPACLLKYGRVMTDEQFETLRRQISVYSTICSQLVEMHKALMSQQSFMPSWSSCSLVLSHFCNVLCRTKPNRDSNVQFKTTHGKLHHGQVSYLVHPIESI